MERLRKAWLPWTAADRFDSEPAFGQWLRRRLKVFGDLRIVLLIAATGLLIVGYVMELRPVMLLSVLPLVLMVGLTLAIGKTEEALNRTKNTEL